MTISWFRKKKKKKLRNIRCTSRIKTRDKNRTRRANAKPRGSERKTDSPRAIKFALVSVYKPPGERITGFFASINRILEREKFLDNRWITPLRSAKLSIRVVILSIEYRCRIFIILSRSNLLLRRVKKLYTHLYIILENYIYIVNFIFDHFYPL